MAHRNPLLLVLVLAAACGSDPARAPLVEGPATVVGWSDVEPLESSQVIHVSNSGNDANPGTLESPKATFRAGYEALRDGEADALLLERGGTWMLDDIFQWTKSGPAGADAGWMILGDYGDESLPRPKLNSGVSSGLALSPGFQASRPLTHVAVMDIHLVAQGRLDNPAGAPEGPAGLQTVSVQYQGSGLPIQHVLIENVRIEGYAFGYSGADDVQDLRIRRNIFTEIFNPGGNGAHGSAILTEADGLLVEENVFYRIQHPDMPAVDAISVFAHSAYIGAFAQNVVTRANIVIKATEGFMQRAGGTFERNVSAYTEIAHLSGQAYGVLPKPGGVEVSIENNLFLNAASDLVLGNTASGVVRNNLIVADTAVAATPGVSLIPVNPGQGGDNIGVHSTRFEGNRLSGDFAYAGDQADLASYSNLTFVENETDLGPVDVAVSDFVSSVGLSGDIDTYGRDLLTRDRLSFRSRHQAKAMLNFYREALGMAALP